MVPGSIYDRSGAGSSSATNGLSTYIPRAAANVNDPYSRLHDPIGYIAPERAQAVAALPAMPVPVGVFMNMTHVPPRFGQQQGVQGSMKTSMRSKENAGRTGPKPGKAANKGGSSLFTQSLTQNTQDISTQPFSQGGMALTQGMSQVKLLFQCIQVFSCTFLFYVQGMSQTVSGFGALSQTGLSQLDPSQDVYLPTDYQSQIDGLLSQDSTYQGGRSAMLRHGSQFTQVYSRATTFPC